MLKIFIQIYINLRCVPLLNSLLDKLVFKCIYFKSGCEERINYSNYIKHNDECGYKEITCSSNGCNKKMLKLKLPDHLEKECEFVMVEC